MSNPSALLSSRAFGSVDLLSVLSSFLLRVQGDAVILLRPLASDFDLRRDDVDLLLSEAQRIEILAAAFDAAAAGRIHMNVRQGNPKKIQLMLWNIECTSSLTVDLWSAFGQLPGHRGQLIRADRLQKISASDGSVNHNLPKSFERTLSGTIRLPADIEFCLLVLHLVSKNKSLVSSVVRERLRHASDRLRISLFGEANSLSTLADRPDEGAFLLNAAELILDSIHIPAKLVTEIEGWLLKRISAAAGDSCKPVLETKEYGRFFISARRCLMEYASCLAIVGSDGAGKSSVCQCLADSMHSGITQLVAKKLYRRSLLYQILSGVAKRVAGVDRCRFDDQVALWITLRASVSLWLRVTLRASSAVASLLTGRFAATGGLPPRLRQRRRRTLLLDRSVASFLILGRKSDVPQLHESALQFERGIPPVTTVLLTVPFTQLAERRQEMTCRGHNRYQKLLFQQALRQRPSDVIVIANTRTADDAAKCIRLIHCNGPVKVTAILAEEAAA